MKILGVGDLGASNTPGDQIKTFALGSCVSVIFHHRLTKTVGMVHIALPDSSINKTNRPLSHLSQPGYFADTGIPALIAQMKTLGCDPASNPGRFSVKIAGGANVMKTHTTFQIGKRNILAVKKILWFYRLAPLAEDIGGTISRTVTVDVSSGLVTLSSPSRGEWTI